MKTILLPVLSLIAALAFVKPADAVIGAHTCTTTYTTKSGDTCATLSAKAGWSVSKFEAINPTVSCSPLKTGVKVCTVIQYIKTTTTTTKTTTAKTTTTTKKTTTTTKPTTTTAKSTTTTKPTTTTTKATTTTKPTTTTTKTSTTAKSSSTGSTSGCTKTYTVASGDSCWQIATNNGLQEPVFESYNPGIDCTALQIGQVVCVNTGSVASTIATTTTTKTTATTTLATSVPSGSTFVCSKTYTVISGDNCYAIATNLGMAEPVFESYNPGINCALLQVGQVVCTGGSYTTATKTSTSATATPTSTYGCTKTHVIGSTEYCYSIAQNANISLDQLLSYNTNLSCNNLKPGTSLCVAVGPNGGAFPIIPIYSCSVANTFAITFDDGPYKYTQELVNYLNNNSITATFFINGQNYGNIYDYKDFLISAYKSGHQIAHHTWSHANISTLTDDELRLEITQLEDAFLDILGVIPTYFRPPFGEYLDSSLKVLNSLGYKVIVWDIDTDDWQLDNFAKEKTNFLNGIADNTGLPGHISLEHDPHQVTVEQLVPWAFPYVKSLGYKATTVSECIGDNPKNWYRTKSLR